MSRLKKHKSSDLEQSERSERRAKSDDLQKPIRSSRVATAAKRPRIDNAFKQKVINELNELPKGEKGLYLRKKGLYSSQVSVWRKEMQKNTKKPPTLKDENSFLEKRIKKLEARNKTLEDLIELQKKMAEILVTQSQDDQEQLK